MRQMINYRDYLIKELSDPEEAIVYLEVSIKEYQKDGDTVAFLLALQSIAEAQGVNNELLSQVYLLSGEVHRSRGEYGWAIEDYNTVIDMKPDMEYGNDIANWWKEYLTYVERNGRRHHQDSCERF